MSYDFDFYEMEQELDEITEQMRQERIARGLPPERPPYFVPMPVTCFLLERVWPLRQIIVRYALLVNNAKVVLPLDVSGLRVRYEKDLNLLGESVGLISGLTAALLRQSLEAIHEAQIDAESESSTEVAEELVRTLYSNLDLCKGMPSLGDLNIDDGAEDKAEYERLKSDDALIQAEIDKFTAEYESIRHLL